jgi:UrcA family protein
MSTKLAVAGARLVLGVATVAGTLFATNPAFAGDHNVTVVLHVSAKGLDLNRPADARTFYSRLENASWVACTRGDRVDLLPVDDLKGCYEGALGGAIRSAKAPMLTQIYLTTHTVLEAAAHGVDLPAQVAAVPRR